MASGDARKAQDGKDDNNEADDIKNVTHGALLQRKLMMATMTTMRPMIVSIPRIADAPFDTIY
ncbi:hypothetical protein A8B78_08620 [Jannaschia sp. EhC01]|nr:hypothetical protein A8B78_08620 [Jannaschia sp. EhC01]